MRPLFTVISIAHCLSGFKWHCTFINIVIMSSSRSWFQIYLICRRKQGAKNYYELKGICRKSTLRAKEQRVARCQEETATDSSKRGKMFAPCKAKSYKRLFLPLFHLLHCLSLCHPISFYSLAIPFVFIAPHCLRKRFATVHDKSATQMRRSKIWELTLLNMSDVAHLDLRSTTWVAPGTVWSGTVIFTHYQLVHSNIQIQQ